MFPTRQRNDGVISSVLGTARPCALVALWIVGGKLYVAWRATRHEKNRIKNSQRVVLGLFRVCRNGFSYEKKKSPQMPINGEIFWG